MTGAVPLLSATLAIATTSGLWVRFWRHVNEVNFGLGSWADETTAPLAQPLSPQLRTSAESATTAAWCHQRTCIGVEDRHIKLLVDYLISSVELLELLGNPITAAALGY